MRPLRALATSWLLTAFATASLAQAPAVRSGPPSWAADAIWYQIFPERFKNGDPRNDPRPADLRGAWPNDPLRDWQVAPWTANRQLAWNNSSPTLR